MLPTPNQFWRRGPESKDLPALLLVVRPPGVERENVNPSAKPLPMLLEALRKRYRCDVKRAHWDGSAESTAALQRQLEAHTADYYKARAQESKHLKLPKVTAGRAADARKYVRKAYKAGMLLELQRKPMDAATSYSDGFRHLCQHFGGFVLGPNTDTARQQVMEAATWLAYKWWQVEVRVHRMAQFRAAFQELLRFCSPSSEGARGLAAHETVWLLEWKASHHVIAANLLQTAASTATSDALEDYAFFYWFDAAKAFRAARTLALKGAPMTDEQGARFSKSVTHCLTAAYTELRRFPLPLKRFKMQLGVLLATEEADAGRVHEALQMCQRMSAPLDGKPSRFKEERWWSLLGAVDDIAASSAALIPGMEATAVRHALRCLSPAARAPAPTRTRMLELVLRLRRLPAAEAVEWVLERDVNECIISVSARFERPKVAPNAANAGALFLTSQLPFAVEFEQLVLLTSEPNVRPFVAPDAFPLLLKPNVTAVVAFACRAPPSPSVHRVALVSATLVLGGVSLVRDFGSTRGPRFAVDPSLAQVGSGALPLAKLPSTALAVATTSMTATSTAIAAAAACKEIVRPLALDSQGVLDGYRCGMTAETLARALDVPAGVQRAPVRGIDLSGNTALRPEGVFALASWLTSGGAPQLGSLSLWNCQLGPQAGAHVATVLRSCPGLRLLNVGLNCLGDAGVAGFASALPIAAALEELVLWRVHLTRTGFTVLLENLLPPCRVQTLDVRANELGEDCDAMLLAFLARNTALVHLRLVDNALATQRSATSMRDFAASAAQCNFSVQSFGAPEDDDAGPDGDAKGDALAPLLAVARRNKEFARMLREGTCSLPFKAVTAVPALLLQPIGPGRRITHLDLSHNSLTRLPAQLVLLECVTQMILARNAIAELTPDWTRMRSLTMLDVSHNQVGALPAELGSCRLRHLLVSNNVLMALPAEMFHAHAPVCASLEVLDVSCNRIAGALPGTLSNLRAAKTLNFGTNRITDVFAGLAKLFGAGALESCNVAHNALESLPPALSQWKDRISIVDNPLSQFPHEITARGPTAVWDYLVDMLLGHQMNTRMKLMLVGQGNVGKSTLLKVLRDGKMDVKDKAKVFISGAGTRKQTEGIEVEDWAPEPGLCFSTWDFAGQEVYYNTHQFFLSQRSLYLVVFSLALALDDNNILTWLNSLQVRAPGVPVLLVGTHADDKRCTPAHLAEQSNALEAIIGKWERLYRKDIRIRIAKNTAAGLCFFPVGAGAARQRNSGVLPLREALLAVARVQPCLKERVPNTYLGLEETIKRKRAELPFANLETVRLWGVIADELSLRRACRLLHDQGVIVSFLDDADENGASDALPQRLSADGSNGGSGGGGGGGVSTPSSKLSDLVILDPNWLTKFMTTVVGVNSAPRATRALVTPASLPLLWRDYSPALYPALCRLLERFEVWVRLSSGDYLVPCLLDSQPERNSFDVGARPLDRTVGRVYMIPFCPHGFWSHLLLRVWSFCRVLEYWSSGAVLELELSTALVAIRAAPSESNPFQAQIQILARGLQSTRLITKIVFTLHAFIQDWYDGLSDHITAHLPCVECLKRRDASCHLFEANAFIRDYLATGASPSDGTVLCPACGAMVAVCDMVPEVIGIVDGQGYASEVVEGAPLGVGGFAEVLQGTWRGQRVAVKKLFLQSASMGADGFTLKTFENFAMEIDLMSRLSHPNVVKLYAAYSRPPAIVLEYVPLGSLDGVLKAMTGPLDWPLILRMASDVALGVEYLHGRSPRVLHRDLKTPNILVQRCVEGLLFFFFFFPPPLLF